MELEETAQRLRRKANRGKKRGWFHTVESEQAGDAAPKIHPGGIAHPSSGRKITGWAPCTDQKTLYESINAKIFTWSLQAQNVLRTSGLIIHLKKPERVNLWKHQACYLCAQFHYYFSSLHSQTLLFTPTYKPSGRWETLSIIQNLISFPMQQDKNHIKLQEKGRENKINPHNPTSSATHRICIPTFPSQPVRSVFCRFPLSSLSLCTATACLAGWDWSRQVWKNHRGLNIIRLTLKAQELTGLRKQLPIFPPWGCSDLGRERENP